MIRHTIMAGATGAALMATVAIAQDASEPLGASAQGDVAVSIYQNGQALVQDVRRLDIERGRSQIQFPDVSARIRPETLSFAAPDTAIVEQNFDFDLLTPTKMMEKAIGRTVTLIRTNPATGAETRERATVLSTAGGVVLRIGDRIEVLRDDGLPVRVIFDEVPPNLRARPTLSVNVESTRGGTRPVSIRYLTTGLGWSADYVALYDEASDAIDMQGWVTLTNQTGTTFTQAQTLLVAGNPAASEQRGRIRQPRGSVSRRGGGFVPGTETADRESIGELYLYPLAERTTIANAQTKQVSFLDVQGVAARKTYTRTVGWLSNDGQPVNAASEIVFSSSRDGGLGDALPAGTVRFYQKDARGTPQFIGENGIGHTPMGSELSLKTGDAFDVFTQAAVEKRERLSAQEWERTARYTVFEDGEEVRRIEAERPVTYWQTTMRYTLTNAKSTPVSIDLTQAGLDRGWWSRDFRIVAEDLPGEQDSMDQRSWVVPVPANGTREFRVTYATRY